MFMKHIECYLAENSKELDFSFQTREIISPSIKKSIMNIFLNVLFSSIIKNLIGSSADIPKIY